MRRLLVALAVLLVLSTSAKASGMLIPVDKALPPLALLDHKVTVTIDDQAAVTRIEQTFRNHTPRQLEATYLFPVPKGASVRKFTMWVNGKEEPGEVVEAEQGPQDLHRHRDPHPRPRPARIHEQQASSRFASSRSPPTAISASA